MTSTLKNISTGLLAVLAGLATTVAQAQDVKALKLAASSVAANSSASLQVEFTPSANGAACGATIDWGNGSRQDVRLGIDALKDSPVTLNQVYPNPGTYNIKLEGKFLVRGLRSAPACNIAAAPVALKVTDPAAEAALREAAIRAQEASAREKAALADAARAKQDLERQQAAAREMEFDLKRKELERREAQLRRDEEMRRAVVTRPATPAPVAAAPAPAAPAGNRPPVKAADGF